MGVFVVLEAIDRAGKTTNSAGLLTALREAGRRVALTAYPNREAPLTGWLIQPFLDGHLPMVAGSTRADARTRMLMGQQLFALNRREMAPHLEMLLADHDLVLCSRYQLSGRVYALGGGVPADDLDALFAIEADLRRPDLTIVIDVDPGVTMARERDDLDTFDSNETLQRATRNAYVAAAEADPSIVLIDGTGDIATVRARITATVAARFPDLGIA